MFEIKNETNIAFLPVNFMDLNVFKLIPILLQFNRKIYNTQFVRKK